MSSLVRLDVSLIFLDSNAATSVMIATNLFLWLLTQYSTLAIRAHKIVYIRDFPGGPVVKTLCFHCREHGF